MPDDPPLMRLISPVRSALTAAEGLFDRLLCVAGAILFSQVPEFIQQYLQRLGGHLDEAQRQLGRLRAAAEASGLTVEQLAARTEADPDAAIGKLGGVLREAISRVQQLSEAEAAIRHASLWTKPFVFARYYDEAIARATGSVFRPAVPTTIEGLVYALVGMALMLALYHLGAKALVRKVARRRALNVGARSPTWPVPPPR